MGVVFLEHPGGQRFFCCGNCNIASTALANKCELISTKFTGSTGRAFLFRKVYNVQLLRAETRVMMTGRHVVRDVVCKQCSVKLGWFYEYAMEEEQRYKEGHFILEKALIVEHHIRSSNLALSDTSHAGAGSTAHGFEQFALNQHDLYL